MGSLSGGRIAAIAVEIGKGLLALIPTIFVAAKLALSLMARVARLHNDELYLMVSLALGFATAAATQALGLSLALGAFLAGMVISESEQAHETLVSSCLSETRSSPCSS